MPRTVLVGVDGSATASSAATRAAEFADALGGELHVLTAFEHQHGERIGPAGEVFVHDNESSALETAAHQAAQLRGAFGELGIVSHAAHGSPAEALVSLAEALQAELIVVGNKRVQGAARILGSIATDVIRKAPCDVTIAYTHENRSLSGHPAGDVRAHPAGGTGR